MTETVLVSIILCICGGLKDNNQLKKIDCLETYTNCAVGRGGVILDKKAFIKQCNYTYGQEGCLK